MSYYLDEDEARYAAEDAAYDAFLDSLPNCEGDGYVLTPCSGRHRYPCGGPDCDGGEEIECPGCPDCQPDD